MQPVFIDHARGLEMAVNSENEFMKLRHALNMHRQQNQHQVSGKLRATKSWLDGVFTAVG